MDITNDGTVTSECEFVSENEVATNTKRKKRKNQKGSNKKDDAKPPRPAPPSTGEAPDHMKKKRSIWWKHFEKTEVVDVAEFPRLWEFNPEVIRRALARMLIVDELPFSFVEREDGLDDVNLSIKKIRTIVKYVRSSPARLQKFKACIEEEKIESKSLVSMDVDTRCNSTFLMLESALKIKKAFSNLLLKDSNCEKELKKCEGGLISGADWTNHTDMSVKTMAQKMQKKYKKYWGDADKLNQFLFIAGVLDPRRKWKYIEWVVAENFNKDSAAIFLIKLEHNMLSLFDMYHSAMPQKEHDEVSSISSTFVSNAMWGNDVMDIDAMMTKRFEMAMGSSETTTRKTELDKYLGEDREPMDLHFDILTWWKVQKCLNDLNLEQPTIIIDETVDETSGITDLT
ncbi:unnamed protein product [Lactuca virosa]|uniref:hAT-like transposase RNase-H fold domain-containing protein n=1 Tax=Lactuca virosa TaxID=75947 RepID=A0AAU9NY88_9ASTR|nr:unnamed protein product [Lactuca virosa]